MTEDALILLCFRIVLIAAFISLTAFVVQYTRLAPWWRDPLGRTIVIKSGLLALALVPSILSLFFNFSRRDSHVAAWLDIALFGAITPVMIWRIIIWQKIHTAAEGPASGRSPAGPSVP